MRRSWIWLLAAALLVLAAGWLMSRDEGRRADGKERAEIVFPRQPKPEEYDRMHRRRTLQPRPPSPEEPIPPAHDPLMVALPSEPGRSMVVFEASALRSSPFGRHLLDCLLSEREYEEIQRFERDYGLDLLDGVERVGVTGGVAAIAGDFERTQWEKLAADTYPRSYGDKATIYEPIGAGSQGFAAWNGELVMIAEDTALLEEAIDRLEGRAPPAPPAIPEWASYGEIYGVIATEQIADLLPPDQRPIADRLRRAAEQIELHVDASEDVAIVLDVAGPDPTQVSDLGRSLGAALAVGRVQAQAEGDDRLVELLDLARVDPHGDGRFTVDLALPLPLLQRHLGPCRRTTPP